MLVGIVVKLKLVVAGCCHLELDSESGAPGKPKYHDLAVEAFTASLGNAVGVSFAHDGTHSFTLKSGAELTIHVYSSYQYSVTKIDSTAQVISRVVSDLIPINESQTSSTLS